MNDNTLVAFGGGIKMLAETEDGWRIGGWIVVHDSHDVSSLRDKFLKSTDYDIEDGEKRTLYYNHGLDGTMKKAKLGRVALTVKDAGVWMEGEIKKRGDYLKQHVEKIAEGVKAGVFGLSSGVPAHLVERKAVDGGHVIEMWPLSEASITPTPAEPLTSCLSLKSLMLLEEEEREEEDAALSGEEPESTKQLASADVKFAQQMVPHHEMALKMARAEIKDGEDAELKKLAQSILAGQQREIEQMTRWLAERGEKPAAAMSMKSADEIKSEINNSLLPAGLEFDEESTQVLAACQRFRARLEGLHSVRAGSRKSGRVFSRAKLQTIAEHRDSLSQLMDAMDAMREQLADWIEEHGESEVEHAGKSLQVDTSQDAVKAMAAFQLTRARELMAQA